jgi:hypothetical protein
MPNVERLQQLRRVVNAAPDDRFHMAAWCDRSTCGTTYCAAGWAAVDRWFRENTSIDEIFSVNAKGFVTVESEDVFGDLAQLFGLTNESAFNLFGLVPLSDDPHLVTKAMVIANIDALIEGRKARTYTSMIDAIPRRR